MSTVNPDQFKLFMTGTEWQAHVTHSTDGPLPDLWTQKEAEARRPHSGASHKGQHVVDGTLYGGLYDHMASRGYQKELGDTDPINKSQPTIILEDAPGGKDVRKVQSEGHHRVAAAAAIERDTGRPVYIPTNYVDNTSSARTRHRAALGVRP